MIILGLAVATCEHHAAALVVDGAVVGAAEEERFNGVKHYGWHPPGQPGANLVNTPDLTINDALCRGVVRWLLERQDLQLEDVDVIALNGIPHRFAGSRECVQEGRYVFVPHHLAHAALAARTSPYTDCNVLTVDGRGEYETAAWFTYRNGEIQRRGELPAGEGRSIGGAYETVTRALGFGPHGQGQTMALAAFGEPQSDRLSSAFQIRGFSDFTLDERALQSLSIERLTTGPDPSSPLSQDLAADVQAALEEGIVALAQEGQSADPNPRWVLAGGVALNCRANSVVRDALGVELWVPSSAHDGGTALGAALEAAHILGEPACGPVWSAGLGPDLDQEVCRRELLSLGLSPVDCDNPVEMAAEWLSEGRVIGWAQGGMEFGPRALGHRSIVAHPGAPGIQDRVNRIKDRQAWRPFGPSVLAEHASDWFEDTAFGPYMTFTSQVRDNKRALVSGVVHVDGSTRPQRVDQSGDPRWRELLLEFNERTGLPMVLNTSFNGRGEPIVCFPGHIVHSARRLELDGLLIGDHFVDLS